MKDPTLVTRRQLIGTSCALAVAAFPLPGIAGEPAVGDGSTEEPTDDVLAAFLALKSYGCIHASPNQTLVAAEIRRDRASGRLPLGESMDDQDCLSDIWIFDLHDDTHHQLTDG